MRVSKVVKRDGRIVNFDSSRIENAIKKAMLSTGTYDKEVLRKVVDFVLKIISQKYDEKNIPHVEDIQDIVEFALVKFDLYEVAKAYILYRKERERIREEKKRILEKDYVDEVDKAFSINALRLLASRYLLKDENGRLVETPKQLFQRVAGLVVIPDILHDPRVFSREGGLKPHSAEEFNPSEWVGKLGLGLKPNGFEYTWNEWHLERMKSLYDELNSQGKMKVSWSSFLKMLSKGEFDEYYANFLEYYSMMVEKRFLPNSPTLFNAGTKIGQLSACFVLDIEDDMESIMKAARDCALIFKSGGGVGINYSKLRPEGDIVSSTMGTACFKGDVRIMTDSGLLKIEEIVKKKSLTKAYTHDGWKLIKNRFSNGTMDVYRVVTEDGYECYVTPEHRFVVFDEAGNMHLRELVNLKEGDHVYILADKAEFKSSYCKLDLDVNLKAEGKEIELPRYLDEDLAYIIGLIMADGHVVKSHPSRIEICLNAEKESEIARKATDILRRKIKLCPKVSRTKLNKLIVKIDSTLFVKFLEKNNLLKESSESIYVPEQLFRSPLNVIKAFIAGYFDGDGSVSINDHCRIQLKSNSDRFIKDLQLLLLCLGIVAPRVEYFPKTSGEKRVFILRIQTKDMKKKFVEEISEYSVKLSKIKDSLLHMISKGKNRKFSLPFNAIYKIKDPRIRAKLQRDYKLISYNSKVTHRGFLNRLLSLSKELPLSEEEFEYFRLLSKLYPNKIVKVEYVGKFPVYDLEVEETHLLVGNGFYTSNSGPVSFMKIIDTVTEVVKQGGKRRGANMGILEVSHPDIEKFITAKTREGVLENFNLSVLIPEDFWIHYRSNKPYPLINPRDKSVWKHVDPKHIFEMIAETAWKTGDPGVLFQENINRRNVLKKVKGEIKSTNPCGEEPLYPYESCNLGSINLYAFVRGEESRFFDWKGFEKTVRVALRFLDNVIDVNKFPLKEIESETKRTRKVGLGLMGLADTLFALKIPYNSEEGFEFMRKVAEHLTYYAMDESVEVAKERGSFPLYSKSGYADGEMPVEGFYHRDWWTLDWSKLSEKIRRHGIRNAEVTTIAPTGSISMLADTSSGIEPQFALIYEKRVTVGTFYYVDPEFERQLRENGIYDGRILKKVADNGGSVQGLSEIPEEMRRVFLVAYDIPWWDHVRAQAELNKWICAAVSKTINMPNWVSPKDVEKAFLFAWRLGLKGITIYRDGSKTAQVLVTPSQREGKYVYLTENKTLELMKEVGLEPPTMEKHVKVFVPKVSMLELEKPAKKVSITEEFETCPVCGSKKLIYEESCVKCLDCGWVACVAA